MKNDVLYNERFSVINPSTDPFNIIVGHFGYEKTLPTKEPITSEEYHTFRLHYVVKGSVIYGYNKQKRIVKKNSCFLLSPKSDSYYRTNPEDPATIFWVSFSGLEALRIIELMGFNENSAGVILLSAAQSNAMKNLMSDALKPVSPDLTDIVLLKNFISVTELLAASKKNKSPDNAKRASPSSHIEKALKYIEKNYANPYLSIDDVALSIPVHKNYLSLLFKNSLGVTFTQYLTQKRVEKAIVLLKNTDYSISRISGSVGYADQLYFSKLFRKFNKMSPSEYRKTVSRNDKNDAPFRPFNKQ